MNAAPLREYVSDAIRFWERGRILYNLALTAIVVLHFVSAYPSSRKVLSVNFGLGVFLLAVVANVAYCAAYLVDVFAQSSAFRDVWRKYRWLLLALGTTFAAIITHFVAMGMFVPGTE
jgi:hypothetical protein